MAPSQYGKYVTREIIVQGKYPKITAPIARYNGCGGGGDVLRAEWSCITTPLNTGAFDYVPATPIDEWVWPYPSEEQ